MQAILLAGGEGRRLRPLTHNRPKGMIPVGGAPILEHSVRGLVACGITDITLVVGYRRESIQNHFGDGANWGADIRYAAQERQLGTGHALGVGLEAAQPEGPFLVLPGDNHISPSLLKSLKEHDEEAVLAATQVSVPSEYGVVHLRRDLVTHIEEKPRRPESRLVSTGIYRLPPDIKRHLEGPEAKILTDVVNHAISAGMRLHVFKTEETWQDAVYPWDILAVNDRILRGLTPDTKNATIEQGTTIQGPCQIGTGTQVRTGSYIVGPVVIGKDCDIGPNAVIYGPATVGDHTRIGPFTQIENSLVLDNARVDTGALLRHSIVDDGARIGPRVSTDRGPAIYETGRELRRIDRLGAVIGQDAFLGANTVLEPGAMIGCAVSVAPNRTVRRVPDHGSVV